MPTVTIRSRHPATDTSIRLGYAMFEPTWEDADIDQRADWLAYRWRLICDIRQETQELATWGHQARKVPGHRNPPGRAQYLRRFAGELEETAVLLRRVADRLDRYKRT